MAAATSAVVLGAGEAALRRIWGFGTPALYEWSKDYEYRMVPDQSVMRFGKTIRTNSLGMRGPGFAAPRADPSELRILVVGDSVVNGGSHVDESQLGTAVLQALLDRQLSRPVRVMNVSANSWGPPNQLAWLRINGTFGADIVIVVASSHDLVDLPLHMAEAKAADGQVFNAPWCALSEVAGLAWARSGLAGTSGVEAPPPDEGDAASAAEGRAAFEEMLELLKGSSPHVMVALHWDRDEQAAGTPRPAHDALAAAAAAHAVPVADLGPGFIAAAKDPAGYVGADDIGYLAQPLRLMQDRIHPSEFGQYVLGNELFRMLERSGWYADVIQPGR